jgi:hypothetical protein
MKSIYFKNSKLKSEQNINYQTKTHCYFCSSAVIIKIVAAMAATNNVNCGWVMLTGDGGRDWLGMAATGNRLGYFLKAMAIKVTGKR